MSDLPWHPYFRARDSGAFDASQPLSAYEVALCRSNLQHTITQRSQTRVNWAADQASSLATGFTIGSAVGAEGVLGTVPPPYGGLQSAVWAQEFVWTFFDMEHPAGLDMRVTGLVESGNDTEFGVRIVPFRYPFFDTTLPAIFAGSGSTTSTTADEVLNAQWFPSDGFAGNFADCFFPESIVDADGGYFHDILIPIVRIEIMITATDTTKRSTLSSVQVREFW